MDGKNSPLLNLLRKTRKIKSSSSSDDLIVSERFSNTGNSSLGTPLANLYSSNSANVSGEQLPIPLTVTTQSNKPVESQKYRSDLKDKGQVRSKWHNRLFKNQKERLQSYSIETQSISDPAFPASTYSSPYSTKSAVPRVRYSTITVDARPDLDEILSDMTKFFPGIDELEVIEDSTKSKQRISYRQSAVFESPVSNTYKMLQSPGILPNLIRQEVYH